VGGDVGLLILFGFSGVLGALGIGFAASIVSMIEERIEKRALAAPKSGAAAASPSPVAIGVTTTERASRALPPSSQGA
jgi:hypothetical protein